MAEAPADRRTYLLAIRSRAVTMASLDRDVARRFHHQRR